MCLAIEEAHDSRISHPRSPLVEVSFESQMIPEGTIPGIDAVIAEEVMSGAGR
jgi:hypothetical protein